MGTRSVLIRLWTRLAGNGFPTLNSQFPTIYLLGLTSLVLLKDNDDDDVDDDKKIYNNKKTILTLCF